MHRAQYLVSGERSLHGDFRRFGIADFTDHDDVGVLPQNRAKRVGEGESDLLFDRNLVDAGHLDRKSTRLNSSHRCISYAVFCLKKKKKKRIQAHNQLLKKKKQNDFLDVLCISLWTTKVHE